MAKKQKNKLKTTKKALKTIRRHPLVALATGLGGLGTTLFASEKVRKAAEEAFTSAMNRVSRALNSVRSETGNGPIMAGGNGRGGEQGAAQ